MREKESHSEFTFQIAPKHYQKHNYLTFCNDVLVSILKYADQQKLSSIQLEFKTPTDAEMFAEKTDDSTWQDWLLQNGYRDQLYSVYYRHTFFSLIGDFCNYMLESINCAAKMKVAVSYALLRKPLKDTLGFIEWLYVDKNEVLDLLIQGKPADLEISKDKAKTHTTFVEQKHGGNSFFSFRYDKTSETSLEHIWNNASHLITTKYKISKTELGNLNFVFADESILRRFSDYYYLTVPAIMMYAIDLICDMFEEFAPLNKYTIMMNKLNRIVRATAIFNESPFEQINGLYSDLKIPIICPRCGLKMNMTDRRIYKFLCGKFRCIRCFKLIDTGRYVFDWEKIRFTFNEKIALEQSDSELR